MDRVLIVDDEPAICRLVKRMLDSPSRAIDTVASAEDALQRLGDYDLYILDKNLPGMNGIELAERVRGADRAAGILILTGYASRDSALEALHIGVDGYVEKPVRSDALIERANDALGAAYRRRSLSERLSKARAAARDALSQLDRPAPAFSIVIAHPDRHAAEKLATAVGGTADIMTDLASLEARVDGPAPDLLLADTGLADDLAPTLRHAHERHPEAAIVVTGAPPSLQQVQALIFAGVRAVVEEPLTDQGVHERLARELAALRK